MKRLGWRDCFAFRRGGAVIVHAESGWIDGISAGKFDFFEKLAEMLAAKGVNCGVIPANSPLSRFLSHDTNVHLLAGEFREVGERIFHVMPSYIWGFWYVDPAGVHNSASLGSLPFDPAMIDAAAAKHFFDGVSGHMLRENISKFPQPARGDMADAGAVIYLQQVEGFSRPSHYLTSEEMISTVSRALSGERVYVKPHPQTGKARLDEIVDFVGKFENAEISNASIHDLTAASRVVITQYSAAGFEALMQKKPVIICGKADYQHATMTARTEGELADLLPQAPIKMQDFPFEKYLYWFLHLNCFEPQSEGFEDQIWEKLRLGLNR